MTALPIRRMRELADPRERELAASELEALLFAASRPLAAAQVAKRLYLDEARALELLSQLQQELARPGRGLQLREAAGKWRLTTKPEHDEVIAAESAQRGAKPLSEQALETLAVVALRQPVTTEEVTTTRGAESYGTIETLRRQQLIARAEQRGADSRAARWRTTQKFLEQFGLADLHELYREGQMQKAFGLAYRQEQ